LIVRFGCSDLSSSRLTGRWRGSDRELLEDSLATRHSIREFVWWSSNSSDNIGEESLTLFLYRDNIDE